MTTKQLQVVKRGCGWPIAGGTYAHIAVDDCGLPIWNFLLCEPVPLPDPQAFGISSIGMKLKSRHGMTNVEGKEIFDVYDWIGVSGYPNIMDWVFEVSNFGFHQKVDPAQMTKLVPESYYFGIHSMGWIDNPKPYIDDWQTGFDYPKCPQNHEAHINQDPAMQMCSGLYINDIRHGLEQNARTREVIRQMPSFTYQGWEPPETDTISYTPAIFFRVPLGMMADFVVYEDNKQNAHLDALKELEALDEKMGGVSVAKI